MVNKLMTLLGNTYEFVIKDSINGQFYWIFHNTVGNTEPICQSETYTSKQSCQTSIDILRSSAGSATVSDKTVRGGLLS